MWAPLGPAQVVLARQLGGVAGRVRQPFQVSVTNRSQQPQRVTPAQYAPTDRQTLVYLGVVAGTPLTRCTPYASTKPRLYGIDQIKTTGARRPHRVTDVPTRRTLRTR